MSLVKEYMVDAPKALLNRTDDPIDSIFAWAAQAIVSSASFGFMLGIVSMHTLGQGWSNTFVHSLTLAAGVNFLVYLYLFASNMRNSIEHMEFSLGGE